MSKLLSVFKSPFKMRLYFLKKLPSLFFWKIKVEDIQPTKSKISIPFCWRTQNPFRSIYFSALAGTAELSTGLLAFLAIENNNMSMLVVGVKGEFIKKANTKTYFICDQGQDIISAVHKAIETGEGQMVTVVSKGYNDQDELIAKFEFTWSFKQRK
ncbi:MAG TPA: DUF4442 domain-containing protein [Saprospiraceae bacterium]|nr:DUF4442 domain-containing protein [Saprospiraceae bacterium]HHH54992.1 DUF4442 domain-containing protein [Bacteroidota bacterium]